MRKLTLPSMCHIILWCVGVLFLFTSCIEKIAPAKEESFSFEQKEHYSQEKIDASYRTYYNGKNPLRIGISPTPSSLPYSLDPHRAITRTEVQLAHLLYTSLTSISPRTGAVVPVLIKSWQLKKNNEGYFYLITLKENIVWGDNTLIHASHVKNSLLRSLDPRVKNPHSAKLALAIRGAAEYYTLPSTSDSNTLQNHVAHIEIEALTPLSLRVGVNSQSIDLMRILAHPCIAILPLSSPFLEHSALFELSPSSWAGNGPFVPKNIEDHTIRLRKNNAFTYNPWVRDIVIQFYPSITLQQEAFEKGEIDWTFTPPITQLSEPHYTPDTPPLAFRDAQKRFYAAQVGIEIPEFSILRHETIYSNLNTSTLPTRPEDPFSPHYTEFETLRTIINHFYSTLNTFNTQKDINHTRIHSIFMPNMAMVKNLFVSVQKPKPPSNKQSTNQSNDPVSTNDPISHELRAEYVPMITNTRTLTNDSYEQYINTIRPLISPDRPFVIAYSHDFLREYAILIEDYMQKRYEDEHSPLPTKIIALRSEGDTFTSYDVAIRWLETEANTPLDILSQIWRITTLNTTSSQSTQKEYETLLSLLYHSSNTDEQFSDIINRLENIMIYTSRYTPLWNSASTEHISSTDFPWWTPVSTWHPIFPVLVY